jgi:hypothetical protein
MKSIQTMPLVKGIPLVLGGVTYTLPPANLATLETIAADIDKVNASLVAGGNVSFGDLFFVVDFATACLRRNYPEMDRKTVAEHLGLENVVEVLQMCLDTSGLMRKRLEAEAQAATTAQGGGTLGESAGTASSLTL